MKFKNSYAWISLFTTLIMITVNALANILPINGRFTGEISDRFEVLFVPAAYVFSIWGLIYLALSGFVIYQLRTSQGSSGLSQSIAPYYWLNNIINAAWILSWHYEIFWLSLVLMLVLLYSLITIYQKIRAARSAFNKLDKLFIQLPFSIYLAWISVATIANAAQVLYLYQWTGWGLSPEVWTGIMLLVASAIGLWMRLREKDTAFVMVLVWAFAGIAIKHGLETLQGSAAMAMVVLLLAAWLLGSFKNSSNTQVE